MKDCAGKGAGMNHLITPQWLDLKDAVAYLAKATNNPWTIAEVLELGRVGKLPMYAVIRPDTGVSCWPESTIKEKTHRWDSERVITFETNPHFEPFKALDFPLVAPQQIAEIQGYGEVSGYEVLIEVPAPNGFTYDHPVLPISMDARGVTIKSYEAIRVKGKELEAFISKEQSAEAVDGIGCRAQKITNTRLNSEEIKLRNEEIRADKRAGMTYRQLMKKYDLSKTRISEICNEEEKTIGGNKNVMANVPGRVIN